MAIPAIAPFAIHHLAIQCHDLARMARFYEKVLRLRVERRWPAEDGRTDRAVWLRLGASVLALETCAGEPVPPEWRSAQPGLHLLALEIPWANRAIWLAHLAHNGVEVAYESPWTIYIRDPEGNRLGLSHFPFDASGQRTA